MHIDSKRTNNVSAVTAVNQFDSHGDSKIGERTNFLSIKKENNPKKDAP